MKLQEICNKLMNVDEKITLVAISYRTESFFKERKDSEILLSEEEIEKSLADAALRWVTRKSLKKLGKPIYAMAKYEKIKRITIPFGMYGIVLCTLLPNSDAENIALQLIDIIKKYVKQ